MVDLITMCSSRSMCAPLSSTSYFLDTMATRNYTRNSVSLESTHCRKCLYVHIWNAICSEGNHRLNRLELLARRERTSRERHHHRQYIDVCNRPTNNNDEKRQKKRRKYKANGSHFLPGARTRARQIHTKNAFISIFGPYLFGSL